MDIQAGRDIAVSIAQERRPAIQIGSDVDYAKVTRGVRAMLVGVVALVAVLLALSFIVKIEEVARARGQFTPVQRVQVIQTPEGGAIEAIMAHNGDRVERGRLIARFRNADLVRDLERTQVRMAYLQINIERLDAFAAGRNPDFEAFKAQYPSMVAEATSLHLEQSRSIARTLDQRDRQVEQEETALQAAQRELPSAKASLDAMHELFLRTREAVNRGVIALNRLPQVQEQAAQSERLYTQLAASVDQHRAQIRSLQAEREAIIAKAAADARNERAQLIVQFDELKAAQSAFQSRAVDIDVRAPINGIIQKISETPIGTVIPAGGIVCEIVPTDGGVLIQAHVSPRDIGFVRIGQEAVVKSDAFDYSRFGTITGRVTRIASSNTQDAPGQAPYILVEIELAQPHVGSNKEQLVTPGMTGEATILTGEKTIFQYLLKPIYLTLDTALRER